MLSVIRYQTTDNRQPTTDNSHALHRSHIRINQQFPLHRHVWPDCDDDSC